MTAAANQVLPIDDDAHARIPFHSSLGHSNFPVVDNTLLDEEHLLCCDTISHCHPRLSSYARHAVDFEVHSIEPNLRTAHITQERTSLFGRPAVSCWLPGCPLIRSFHGDTKRERQLFLRQSLPTQGSTRHPRVLPTSRTKRRVLFGARSSP
ncbi:hypothetical protein Micbo1qcDRAFT_46605 [Microdochium bolleyi]|uniref:Uncharacterized protein n=1 Tax=Microdochium bolleyi TaxID=196109 RepID=A0A136JCB6_9PEZI|nr:hypothetical protein Micbo1qcDRAFT_46605 [Microdochium bolleyi]